MQIRPWHMVYVAFSIRIHICVSICVALSHTEAHILRFVLIKKGSYLAVNGVPRFLDNIGDQETVVIGLSSVRCVISPLVWCPEG